MSVTSLSDLTLISPVLIGSSLSVDVDTIPLVFTADVDTQTLEVSIQETGQSLSFQPTGSSSSAKQFAFSLDLPAALGTYHLSIRAKDTQSMRVSPSYTLTVIRGTNENVPQALPPAGIRVYRLADKVKVEWQTPEDEGFLGVRCTCSTDASGVTTPFEQVGGLIQGVSRTAQDVASTSKRVALNGTLRTTTVDEDLVTVKYSSIEFLKSSITADVFYVALTTLIQDPDTHHVHESFAAGPFECSFVDLRKVTLTDYPGAFTPESNASSLIRPMTSRHPELDLGARSEARDLFVDPVAIEQSAESTRGWFTRVCQSPSALLAIDDADGDGVSDPVETNSYKQALMRAFRLTAAQMQSVIDKMFDAMGERAGRPRKGTEASVVDVLFYVTYRPTERIEITEGALVNTLPDSETSSLSFVTLGSAVIDPAAADSFYIADKGWWGVTIPCMCTTEGSSGNVGAGTIRTVISGVNTSVQCTNLFAADFGLDTESNYDYACRIADGLVAGGDSGRRLGYLDTARKAYGVIKAKVVASGDVEMLRDWDPIRQRHIFGTVDVYVRGRSFSQNTQRIPYLHEVLQGTQGVPSTYASVSVEDTAKLRLKFDAVIPEHPIAAIVELYAERQGSSSSLSFYFGVDRACYDAATQRIYLHPQDVSYRVVNGEVVPGAANSELISTVANGTQLRALVRMWSSLAVTPTHQPVTQVSSISGEDGVTGVIPSSAIRLIKTEDPLLTGGSSLANDQVSVDNVTSLQTKKLTFATGSPDVIDLGEGISLAIQSTGVPGNILSVLSSDGSSLSNTLYRYGVAYSIVTLGQYARYGLKRLAGDSSVEGGVIPLDKEILVSFESYRFVEHLTLRSDTLILSGSTYTPLAYPGLVSNVWIPGSHGVNDLLQDAQLISAGVSRSARWIKVTYTDKDGNTAVALPGRDYTLDIDDATGVASIARFHSGGSISSRISDGGAVVVSYYTAETFKVVTRYPQFISQLAETYESTRNGCADISVKAMQESLVDMDLTIDLKAGTAPESLDKKIRTVIVAAHDNADKLLSQASLVQRIKSLPGVANVRLPFRRLSKADGSYDVGMVIPTGTLWDSVSTLRASDPAWSSLTFSDRAFVTRSPVLRYHTLPSGGTKDAYVGLLYEGESYHRCLTLEEFQGATSAAFYIIGVNDRINSHTAMDSAHYGKILLVPPAATTLRPQPLTDPGIQAYRVTYQVYGEAGAQDIPMSPTEYLRPGKVSIDYVLGEDAQ